MEEKSTSTFKFALTYGLITGAAIIVVALIFYVLEVPRESPIQYASYLVYIAGMIWGANVYKNEYGNGFLSYGKAFGISYLIGILAAIIGSIYAFIYIKYIDPSVITESLAAAEQRLLDQDMSDADIDNALEITERFMNPMIMAIMAFVMNAIILAVIGLITSIFVKKEERI